LYPILSSAEGGGVTDFFCEYPVEKIPDKIRINPARANLVGCRFFIVK
jgi:hypothetical protein